MAIALFACLLLPKRYTSTASILIEPPAGSDPRMFTAISPIYLESLKTYETFATSGALFQRALEKFQLREQGGAIESIKARVLKVSKLRDTKVLQISVTLENPKQAQAMVQFMAEETVKLIGAVSRANGREIIDDLRRQSDEAKQRLEQTQTALSKVNQAHSIETLRSEVDSLIELQSRTRSELYEAEAAAAAYDAQSAKARVASLGRSTREMEESLRAKTRILTEASSQIEKLETDRKTAQALYDAALRRQQELNSWLSSSGERLQVIDPGIVPERPSEPRPALYTGIAGTLALLAAVGWLSFGYGLRR